MTSSIFVGCLRENFYHINSLINSDTNNFEQQLPLSQTVSVDPSNITIDDLLNNFQNIMIHQDFLKGHVFFLCELSLYVCKNL